MEAPQKENGYKKKRSLVFRGSCFLDKGEMVTESLCE